MDINIKRIKSSPYKMVVSKDVIVGIFDKGQFIHRDFFSAEQIKAIETIRSHNGKRMG